MGAPKINRRRDERFTYGQQQYAKGRFTSNLGKGKTQIHPTQVYDLSSTGASFWVLEEKAPQIGTPVGIEFHTPLGEQIALAGKVVRIESPELLPDAEGVVQFPQLAKVAVEFLNPPAAYKKLIKEEINNIKKELNTIPLDERLESLGLKIYSTIQKNPMVFNFFVVVMSFILCLLFMFKMYDIAETKWWVQQAKEFQKKKQ